MIHKGKPKDQGQTLHPPNQPTDLAYHTSSSSSKDWLPPRGLFSATATSIFTLIFPSPLLAVFAPPQVWEKCKPHKYSNSPQCHRHQQSIHPNQAPPSYQVNQVIHPYFFKGAAKDGEGPGPHFITMSFVKDKTKIRDQLLKALAIAVFILTNNIPGALVHFISKDAKLPPLSSATTSNFPTSGMQARYYLFIQNAWYLQPGTRNKPKLPTPKVGKDGRQLFDKNQGYDGPDCITSIMWVTADINVKDALENLQMELEGKHLQIRWKAAQKKSTKKQMVIYGLPPGFDTKGIMRKPRYGLKQSEKPLQHASPAAQWI
jgi:hypothetical protein